jgi:Flp pilus assembly protein TadG
MQNSTKGKPSHSKGQGMAEFALALPILMLVIFGLLEVGRALFMYAAVTNASREAVRFATAYGVNESDVLHIQNCAAIRNTARRVAFLMTLEDDDIEIAYDTGPTLIDPDGTPDTGDESYGPPPDPPDKGTCDDNADGVTDGVDATIDLECGDRVVVTVTYDYQPIVPIVPMTAQTFTSSSARTFLGVIELSDDPAKCK